MAIKSEWKYFIFIFVWFFYIYKLIKQNTSRFSKSFAYTKQGQKLFKNRKKYKKNIADELAGIGRELDSGRCLLCKDLFVVLNYFFRSCTSLLIYPHRLRIACVILLLPIHYMISIKIRDYMSANCRFWLVININATK